MNYDLKLTSPDGTLLRDCQVEPELAEFMIKLADNQLSALKLILAGKFFSEHHDIHDQIPDHECSDCYSDDTEFEQRNKVKDALEKFF